MQTQLIKLMELMLPLAVMQRLQLTTLRLRPKSLPLRRKSLPREAMPQHLLLLLPRCSCSFDIHGLELIINYEAYIFLGFTESLNSRYEIKKSC